MEKKEHLDKILLKKLVQKAYSYTGKGNNRKRTLEEVLRIIDDKKAYFNEMNNPELDEVIEI
jgi:hypothetical protein